MNLTGRQLFFWAWKMEMLFWCVVLGRLEKVFGNTILGVFVCLLLCYAVNALDLALESFRIFIWPCNWN